MALILKLLRREKTGSKSSQKLTKSSPHPRWEEKSIYLFFLSATNGNRFKFRSEACFGAKQNPKLYISFNNLVVISFKRMTKLRECTDLIRILEFTNCRKILPRYIQKRMKCASRWPHGYHAGNPGQWLVQTGANHNLLIKPKSVVFAACRTLCRILNLTQGIGLTGSI